MKAVAATVLATALLASAAPSLKPTARSCQFAYPSGFPINFAVSQDAEATNKVDDYISFSIPEGSYGCTLRADFPAGYPIAVSGNSQVYVFDSNDSQVGTVDFASPMSAVINSFVCQPDLTYRLSIGSLDEAGSVAFADTPGAGLTMTFNC